MRRRRCGCWRSAGRWVGRARALHGAEHFRERGCSWRLRNGRRRRNHRWSELRREARFRWGLRSGRRRRLGRLGGNGGDYERLRVVGHRVVGQPAREVEEGREKMRHDDSRSVHVVHGEHLRRCRRLKRADAGAQALPLAGRTHVQVMHHHHPAQRHFLGDLASRPALRECLQDLVCRGKFSACHHVGPTGTLTARLAFGSRFLRQPVYSGWRAPVATRADPPRTRGPARDTPR